ncbi:MAG: 1,2-phenylacetyl-CoA epoxidase subunit PaaC [Bacteroidota bacterium]
MHTEALKELLFKLADDHLVLGHRNSEWTGIGPLLEEDIAFASMAQDKVGQSRVFYNMLTELGETDADTLAFMRSADKMRCCQFTELPIGEYDFSTVRHFLFDHADLLRMEMLRECSYTPLALAARKMYGEIRYHVMHADTWMKQLGNADAETITRMQAALDYAWPYALGMFESSEYEDELKAEGIFEGESVLQTKWMASVMKTLAATRLTVPTGPPPVYGGRKGIHTEYLLQLVDEMGEVFRLDPSAEW